MDLFPTLASQPFPPPVPMLPKPPPLGRPNPLSPLEAAARLAREPMAVTRQKALAGDPVALQKVNRWRAEQAFLEAPTAPSAQRSVGGYFDFLG